MYLNEAVTDNVSNTYIPFFTPKAQKMIGGWFQSCPWFKRKSRKAVSISRLIIPKFC
jgi:hypothetical protein